MPETDEPTKETPSPNASWVSEITPKKPLLHLPFREIWRYRDLIALAIWRDFISLHKQTVFGPLWYFVQPLVSTLVYQLIFGKIAQLPTNNIPPFLFYMSGIVIWYYFSACLSRTSTTFSANAALFTKVYFPATDDPHRRMHKQYLAVPDPADDFPWLLSVLPGQGRPHSSQLSHHHYSFPCPANRPVGAGRGLPDIRA